MDNYVLVSPRNTRIFGPLEHLSAFRHIDQTQINKIGEKGKFEIHLSGERTVFHDSAEIVQRWGERVFVDHEANEFLESELRYVTREEFEHLQVLTSPPFKPGVIERLIEPIDALSGAKKDKFIFGLLELVYAQADGERTFLTDHKYGSVETFAQIKSLIEAAGLRPDLE